jgi:hypothetical protein
MPSPLISDFGPINKFILFSLPDLYNKKDKKALFLLTGKALI